MQCSICSEKLKIYSHSFQNPLSQLSPLKLLIQEQPLQLNNPWQDQGLKEGKGDNMPMKTVKECTCDSWKNSANQIFDAQIAHGLQGVFYTGDTFNYCPWCGHVLTICNQSANDTELTYFAKELK